MNKICLGFEWPACPGILITWYPVILVSLYPDILAPLYPGILITWYPFILVFMYPNILAPFYPWIMVSWYPAQFTCFLHSASEHCVVTSSECIQFMHTSGLMYSKSECAHIHPNVSDVCIPNEDLNSTQHVQCHVFLFLCQYSSVYSYSSVYLWHVCLKHLLFDYKQDICK